MVRLIFFGRNTSRGIFRPILFRQQQKQASQSSGQAF